MQATISKLWEGFAALNKLSRVLLYIGLLLGYAAFLVCWALDVCAGRYGNYWELRMLAAELSACVRSCVGVLGLSALVASLAESE